MQTFPLRDQGMDAALRRGGHFLQHRGPTLLSVLLVLLLAWLLADLTWSFIPQPKATATPAAPAATLRQIDANRVADQHLFGVAGAPAGNGANAPDTTLALTLHGIVAGKRASDSRALIVVNGDEEPYAVGAQLPGGAVIRSIYPDRVLLARDGRLEALRLPTNDTAGAATGNQSAMMQPQAMAPPTQSLGQLRQEIANNPQRLMDVVRAMPVMDHGKLTGYRIYPAGNPSQFNQLGLKPGDVVSAVNGIPLTDPGQSMRVLSSLKTSEQVSVTLIRNGQTQTQILQMPPPALGQPVQEQQQAQPDQDNQDGPP
jgi:general secretion pathway protein C